MVEQPQPAVAWTSRPPHLGHVDRPQPKREHEVCDVDTLRAAARRAAGKKEHVATLAQMLSLDKIPGAKIVDKKDGKTIGKIVSAPAPGTTVLLAQMRLDRVGLLESNEAWSRKNRIVIGEGTKELRYLPYMPLWWPDIDPTCGKAKIEEEES